MVLRPNPSQPTQRRRSRRHDDVNRAGKTTASRRVQPHDERTRDRHIAAREAALDATLDASFPASDPPAWTR